MPIEIKEMSVNMNLTTGSADKSNSTYNNVEKNQQNTIGQQQIIETIEAAIEDALNKKRW